MLLMTFVSFAGGISGADVPQANRTAVSESDTLGMRIEDDLLLIDDIPEPSRLEIYNIVGIKVKELDLAPSGHYAIRLPRGYYIIRIRETVRKIIIR
jgi:hypothetical protein